MTAYRATWDHGVNNRIHDHADLICRFHLPTLICLTCSPKWRQWGSYAQYPAFKFDFLNEREFNMRRSVELSEFERICARIVSAAGREVVVVPGGGIGELEGEAYSTELTDFLWGTILFPQISKRARDLLAEDGIDLLTAECTIKFRGRRIDSHLAIQIEPVALLTEAGMKHLQMSRCPRCGNFTRPPGLHPALPHGREFSRSAWPQGRHLVQSAETCEVIASEEFVEAVKKHNLTGIAFEEAGRFV